MALSTGASLIELTVIAAVSVADENAVALPLTDTSTFEPAVPDVRSQALNVIASLTVPLKFAPGWK